MLLPPDFHFSQASLQDFVDCRRRFQLRYLESVSWPAVETEPALEHEHYTLMGAQFHQLVQQHLLGIPADRLSHLANTHPLNSWWQNYLTHVPKDLPATRYPETKLSASVSGHRFVAKYDLITIDPAGKVAIIDWKTTRKRLRRQWLLDRLQTRVYRFLLVEAGANLNHGKPIEPEQVEMIYWFANFPEEPHSLPYSDNQYLDDMEYLTSLVTLIPQLGDNEFPLTSQEKHCLFCRYRSLCDRGVKAGTLDDLQDIDIEEALSIDLDLEQITETAF